MRWVNGPTLARFPVPGTRGRIGPKLANAISTNAGLPTDPIWLFCRSSRLMVSAMVGVSGMSLGTVAETVALLVQRRRHRLLVGAFLAKLRPCFGVGFAAMKLANVLAHRLFRLPFFQWHLILTI